MYIINNYKIMREGSEKFVPHLRTIPANYSQLDMQETGVDKLNKEVEEIEKSIHFRTNFKDYKTQILYELNGIVDQGSLSRIVKFIEYFFKDKINENKKDKNDYFMYNFSFDSIVNQEFLKLNHLPQKDRRDKFRKIFLDKFEDFIVKEGFRNFPNTEKGSLIFYKKGPKNNFDFKFEYTPWFYYEWEVNKVGKVIEEEKVTLKELMEKKTVQEINKEIKYNNDVKELFFSFINNILYNKALFSDNFIVWNLRADFLIIKKFIKENELYFTEAAENSLSFSLFIGLINFIVNNRLLTIKDIEDKITKELEFTGIYYVDFDEFFYQGLKLEIDQLFKWLNSLVETKKSI